MAEGLGLAPGEAGDETPVIPGYEILRLLGEGGMGRVWLARQTSLDRLVAVKVLATKGVAATQWLDRLEREARSMARLSHPHIVAVYDFVRHEDGGAAIVMEWVGSGSLREKWLASGKPVRDLGAVRSIVWQVASALVAAHGAGIVHRDLKPENILVAVDGSAKVTDFGLALPLGPDWQRLTLSGTSFGTVGYMAPEQLEGKEIDGRADVYSLGVILYELLTGVRPQGHFDPPGKVRRDLPTGLEKLVLDSIRTRPDKRLVSAAEFLARLDRCGRSRRPLVVAACVTLAVLAFGGFALSGMGGKSGEGRNPAIFPDVESPPPAPIPPPSKPAVPAVVAAPTSVLPPGLSVPAGWESRVAVKPLRGQWDVGPQGFRTSADIAILQLFNSLPEEGARIRVTFTRTEGIYSIALFFRTRRGVATAELSAWETNLAGFQCLNGQDLRVLPDTPVVPIVNGRRYEMEVVLLPDRARLSLDGRLVREIGIADFDLSVTYPWEWETLETPSTWLAIGSYESPTLFHEVEVEAIR